ncbi:MAG: hypothetical protein ACTSRZ_10855 [Promethearchaeota archaeon]
MPGIAHIAISLILSAFLIKITNGIFNKKHALIFTVNSLIGPDLMGILFDYESPLYYLTHGYGWFFPAFVVAIPWWFFLKYKINFLTANLTEEKKIDEIAQIKKNKETEKAKKLKKLKITIEAKDFEKKYLLSYAEIYCLIAAGGIFHQAIDLIGHPPFITYQGVPNTPWGVVWFGGDNWFSMEAIWGTGMFPCGFELGFTESYIYLGIILAILILLIFAFMMKNNKNFVLGSIIFFIIYFTPLSITYFIPDPSGFDINAPDVNYYGDPSYVPFVYRLTGGEADLGVLFYILLFWFVPLFLIYLGYKGLPWEKKQGLRAKIDALEREYKEKISRIYLS